MNEPPNPRGSDMSHLTTALGTVLCYVILYWLSDIGGTVASDRCFGGLLAIFCHWLFYRKTTKPQTPEAAT